MNILLLTLITTTQPADLSVEPVESHQLEQTTALPQLASATGQVELGTDVPPAPPRSLGKLIVGSILVGSGVLSIGTAILGVVLESGALFVSGIAGAGAALGVGIPFTVIGANRERRYKAWLEDYGSVEVARANDAGFHRLSFSMSF